MQKLQAQGGVALRAPQIVSSSGNEQVVFENYDDTDYGYLRVVVDAQQLRVEYHLASDGAGVKAPDDSVTIDLATRKRTVYQPNDLGFGGRAKAVQAKVAGPSRGKK